jgi:hypothetical protein
MTRRILVSFALVCGWLAPVICGQHIRKPQSEGFAEYDIKAAFLLNFTRFVTWPAPPAERAASPFAICVFGNDPFGNVLDRTVASETVGSRPLVVRRIRKWPDSCDVLFLPAAESSEASVLTQVGKDVLTVGESSDFLADGGMIRFIVEDRRVRFDISRGAVGRSALKMSSRLMEVARAVVR